MNTARPCPECDSPLPVDAPQGMCPKCLANAADHSLGDTIRTASPAKTIAIDASALVDVSPTIQYFGDYELIQEIARGGMGVVYKARQKSLNRIVAIKMILSGQLAGQSEIKRFHTEAEAAANLQHPNIVAIHEIGEHEGLHYFSMDFVEGRNLSALVCESPLPAQEAARLVKGIADAIQYAHQRGILHRDLKPQNVLIDERNQPRVTDFGLAKMKNQDSGVTGTGAVMGSPSYMPPEQASGRQDQVGPASDVYSVGAILYEVLTGRPPFRAETPVATLQQVVNDEPVLPSKHNPKVPADLETICLTCLEKRPERRYPTARALAEELERFLNQEPIHARPASMMRKSWVWITKRPWIVTGLASAIILGLVGFAYRQGQEVELLRWEKTHLGQGRPYNFDHFFSNGFRAFLGFEFFFLQMVPLVRFFVARRRGTITRVTLFAFVLFGLCQFGLAITLVVRAMAASVWITPFFGLAYSLGFFLLALSNAWFAAILIWLVIREYRNPTDGPTKRPTTPPTAVIYGTKALFSGVTAGVVLVIFLSLPLRGPLFESEFFPLIYAAICGGGFSLLITIVCVTPLLEATAYLPLLVLLGSQGVGIVFDNAVQATALQGLFTGILSVGVALKVGQLTAPQPDSVLMIVRRLIAKALPHKS